MKQSNHNRLILASASPRRNELLRLAGVCFRVQPSGVGEILQELEKPEDFVLRTAFAKADAVAKQATDGSWVLAADTIVVVDDSILGKPESSDHASRMLSLLSGRNHRVLTAVVLLDASGKVFSQHLSETIVRFRTLDQEWIRGYVDTGEPMDKAGAYGIQGKGAVLVRSIQGSYTNVVGLPLAETVQMLEQAGIWRPFADAKQEPSAKNVCAGASR